MRAGKYLNENERYVIEVELRAKTPVAEIARRLGRARSTIHREIKRGLVTQRDYCYSFTRVYKADFAQRMAARRQAAKGTGLKIGNDHVTARVLSNLMVENRWSPGAALGYAKRHRLIPTSICLKTLYSYIHGGVLSVSDKDLPRPRSRRRTQARLYRPAHRNLRGTSIEERPKEVLERRGFGHWEGDLIVGKQSTKAVCLTLVERKTRYLVTALLPSRRACQMVGALDDIERVLGASFRKVFRSITFDNGSEFLDFEGLERSVMGGPARTKVFYAHPYCSGERGTNENVNGLLRRAGLAKGSDLALAGEQGVMEATRWVNTLPRSILGYSCAAECFRDEICALM